MKRTYKHIVAVVLSLILIASFFVLPAAAMDATGTGFFGNVIDDKCFYERAVKLPNGDLLATWCREFPIKTNWSGMKSYIFFKSSDNGSSWLPYSSLDPSNYDGLSRDKTGMPGLYVLPQAVGEYPAGTILFAVSDWDKNAQYCIHIWRSTDNGATWHRNLSLPVTANWCATIPMSASRDMISAWRLKRRVMVAVHGGIIQRLLALAIQRGFVASIRPCGGRECRA